MVRWQADLYRSRAAARNGSGAGCVYQAVRALMNAGAEHARLDPDRISFTRTLQAVARHFSDDAAFPPEHLSP